LLYHHCKRSLSLRWVKIYFILISSLSTFVFPFLLSLFSLQPCGVKETSFYDFSYCGFYSSSCSTIESRRWIDHVFISSTSYTGPAFVLSDGIMDIFKRLKLVFRTSFYMGRCNVMCIGTVRVCKVETGGRGKQDSWLKHMLKDKSTPVRKS
jgi:hypothetical protein